MSMQGGADKGFKRNVLLSDQMKDVSERLSYSLETYEQLLIQKNLLSYFDHLRQKAKISGESLKIAIENIRLFAEELQKVESVYLGNDGYPYPASIEPLGRDIIGVEEEIGIMGFFLANPADSLAKEILDNLQYTDMRSGLFMNIKFAGFGQCVADQVCYEYHRTFGGFKWYFSVQDFIECIKKLETQTCWKYSGDTELILFETRDERVRYNQALIINVNDLMRNGSYDLTDQFIEAILSCTIEANKNVEVRNKMLKDKYNGDVFKYIIDLLPDQIVQACKNMLDARTSAT